MSELSVENPILSYFILGHVCLHLGYFSGPFWFYIFYASLVKFHKFDWVSYNQMCFKP